MINLVGFLLPPLIDLINRRVKDSDARFWISVLVCSLFGIGLELVVSGFMFMGVDPYIESILAMFGLAQLSYKGLYENSRMQTTIRGEKTPTVEVELPKL